MIKICNDPAVYAAYKSQQSEQVKTFLLSEDLFQEARDYANIHCVEDGSCFPVLDTAGKFLFLLQYRENLTLGTKRNDFWDYDERFHEETGLDFSLLDQYRTFIFTEAEEYSVMIARLLQKYRPDKRCFFLDRRTKYFVKGKGVRILPFSGNAGKYMELLKKWMQGKNQGMGFTDRAICLIFYKMIQFLEKRQDICIVATDKEFFWSSELIYNSAKVMYSILWCENKKSFGNKNEDKTIFLLDYPCFNEGLVSIIKWTYTHIRWLLEKGYVPVVNLNRYPNQYLNSEEENMWEYFFEPVSEISLKEVYESKNVISAADNTILLGESKINPYQEKWGRRRLDGAEFSKIVKMNRETEQYIEQKIPKELSGKVLGVVMRGTDFRKEAAEKINKEWRKDIVDAETFLQACIHYKNKFGYKYVFLASEDAEYFTMFQKNFGEELLYIEQKRVYYDYKNQEYIQIKDLLAIKDGKTAGRNYLSVIKCLAMCDSLLYNIECGAVQLAECWNNGRYTLCKHIESNWHFVP